MDRYDENKELLESFAVDAHELLEEIEPRLIELQQSRDVCGSADAETLNSIFRMFHSLKGAASFLNLRNVTAVTHEAETLLNFVREGVFELTPGRTDLLCQTCDMVRVLLHLIEAQGNDHGHTEQVAALQLLLQQACADGAADQAEPPSAPDSGQQHVSESERQRITITPEMVRGFIQESDELLEQAEDSLVDIEKSADCRDRLDNAFRSIHSFKGNCGFMGFADLEKLSHSVENVLEYMKLEALHPTDKNCSMLLRAIDTLRTSVADISDGGGAGIQGCDLMIELLNGLLPEVERMEVPFRLGEILVARGDASSEAVEAALRMQGRHLHDVLNDNGASDMLAAQAAMSDEIQTSARRVARRDIRVDLDKLDAMVDLVGELVIAQLMVVRNPDLQGYDFENFQKASHQLQRVTSELQDIALSIRMVPLSATFRKMIRQVHDLSRKFNKKIKLELVGEETEVDKTVIEQISDPLGHIIRNAIDHGIETASVRAQRGKDEVGTICLEAMYDGGEVLIVVRDDGGGLDRETILAKGLERGLFAGDPELLSTDVLDRLIFEPGFSTAGKVTDVSGRGVGMDVVRRNIEKLKGTVYVESTPGRGTAIKLRIPLTLAIVEGMLVRTGSAHYIIPLLAIRESFRPEPRQITTMPDGYEVVRVREELLRVVRLYELFRTEPEATNLCEGILAIVEFQGEAICLFLDEILGQQQTVIKALPKYMKDIQGVSGCSILGDGQVCLILDVNSLILQAKEYSRSEQVTIGAEMGQQ